VSEEKQILGVSVILASAEFAVVAGDRGFIER
jgi:hypothetical protein